MKEQKNAGSAAKRREIYTGLLFALAAVAMVFSLTVVALMVMNFLQTRATHPLDLPPLDQMARRLQSEPGNDALRGQIRDLDLLARRAFFTSAVFLQRATLLLLGGVLALLASLRAIATLHRRLPMPSRNPPASDPLGSDGLARRTLAVLAGMLAAGALIAAVVARSRVEPAAASAKPPPAAAPAPSEVAPPEQVAKNWPCFRGPGGNGVATFTNAPAAWNGKSGQGIAWKVPAPKPGNSSPVVWGDRVFLTGGDADAREVYCFKAGDGALLWKRQVEAAPGASAKDMEVGDDTGYAASTPATDGKRVFAIFATGDLACYDFEGNPVWAKNLGVPDNPYGHSSSLLVHGDLLIVQYDHKKEARVLAFRNRTGEEVWNTPRTDISWASPICVNSGARTELILTSVPWTIAYDPANGMELWRLECLSGEMGPSAAYADGMVFIGLAYSTGCGINLRETDAGGTPKIAWKWDEALPDVASPVANERFVFWATSSGTITCLDAKQGTSVWTHDFDDGFYASPILTGDRVYALDKAGRMRIFTASDSFTDLGSPSLGEPVVATPAFLDACLYVRAVTNLYRISR